MLIGQRKGQQQEAQVRLLHHRMYRRCSLFAAANHRDEFLSGLSSPSQDARTKYQP